MMTAAPSHPALTASAEDYLKTIYSLGPTGAAATTVEIAGRLGLAPASVTAMLSRLAERGLVNYERYRGVTLTDAGRITALRTIRRHRVLEAFLTRALGYPWDEVHDEAERLEHAASDKLIDRMAEILDEPTVDPHGAPIPTRDGAVDETVYRTLGELTSGERARVERVSDKSPEMLRYLDELALRPGAEVMVISHAPFDGPIAIEIEGAVRSIGRLLAAQVLVATER
ncbi:MAG TPA: metal-dependent transcriptional regulator [Gemmatimonadaceae bacterium]|nr:metal-dependent transcriptional regulator [Gemmatimonadaceae bacterium]